MGMGSIARRVGVVVLLGGALSAVALVAEASPGATATAFAGFGSSVTPGWNRPPTQTGAVRASNSAQTTFRVNPVRSSQSSARSYADLSTGALGVEALTDDPFGDSGATAQFRDVLTFKLPTNVNAVVIPLKFLVSGSVPKIQTPYGSPFGSDRKSVG